MFVGEGWKALDDDAKAKWAADAPEVEVKKKKAKAPEPAPVEVVVKQLSGKEFYNKEKRAEAKAAVERDHADVSGKEKLALVSKALADGWKALDERAQAKWTVDAPRVEVQKRPRAAGKAGKAAASPAKKRKSLSAASPAKSTAVARAKAVRLANRTTWDVEEPLVENFDWRVEDDDETAEPAAPPHRLPPVEDGFTRVFVERAVFTPVGVAPFALDRNGDVPGTRGYLMPKIRVAADGDNETFDEYIGAVHDMYYDVPTDPAEAEDYEVDLTIAFACMYTHAMLVEEFASVGSAALDKCAPPFDEARELAESDDVAYMTSSVDFVRGAVHVAWAPEDCVHFFRNRTVGGGKLSAPKSAPAPEPASPAPKATPAAAATPMAVDAPAAVEAPAAVDAPAAAPMDE